MFLKTLFIFKEDKGKSTEKKKKKKEKKEEEDYPNSWLLSTMYKTFKWLLIESAFFKLLQDLLAFVSPQLLKYIIFLYFSLVFHVYNFVFTKFDANLL